MNTITKYQKLAKKNCKKKLPKTIKNCQKLKLGQAVCRSIPFGNINIDSNYKFQLQTMPTLNPDPDSYLGGKIVQETCVTFDATIPNTVTMMPQS